MAWKIKAVAGPFAGQEIIIDQTRIIGRDQRADIVLQGGHVSRRHAELSVRDHRLWIKDLNSSNGTFVNGSRIDQQQLQENDEFQIDVVRFLVLNSVHDILREKTSEAVSVTSEGRPAQIPVPRPAPMPPVMPAPVMPAPVIPAVEAQAEPAPLQTTAQDNRQDTAQDNTQDGTAPSRPAGQPASKNGLPLIRVMAVLILLLIIAIWYFVA